MLDGEGTLLLDDLVYTIVGICAASEHMCNRTMVRKYARKLVSISEKAMMEPSAPPPLRIIGQANNIQQIGRAHV